MHILTTTCPFAVGGGAELLCTSEYCPAAPLPAQNSISSLWVFYTDLHSLMKLIKVAKSPATTDSFLERDTFQLGRCLDPFPLPLGEFQFFPFHPFIFVYQHLSHD